MDGVKERARLSSHHKKTTRKTTFFFFFSSRRRHTRLQGDWSSDVVLFRSNERNRLVIAVERGVGGIAGGRVLAKQEIVTLVTDFGIDNIGLVLDELSFCNVQLGLVLLHNDLVWLGVDLCAQLTLMDPGVVVATEGND